MSIHDYDEESTIQSVKSQSTQQSCAGQRSCSISQNPRVKRLREKVMLAADFKKLTDLVFEYDDVIHNISTTTLNSWHNIPNYKFAKLKGTVYVSKCESKYMANKVLAERLDACEHNITLLQKCIAELLPAD
jgi:hypothetical protein